MSTRQPGSPLTWIERAAAIPPRGVDRTYRADAAACAALAQAWGIPACHSATATLRLRSLARGRILAEGRASAEIVQDCVVTLEPFETTVEAGIEIEFWPEDQIGPEGGVGGSTEIDVDGLAGEDPEPVRGGVIAVGEVVYQILTAELDPFPRGPDAELERTESSDGAAAEPAGENPFAALEALKPRRESDE